MTRGAARRRAQLRGAGAATGAWERLQGRHFATDPDVFRLLTWQRRVRPHAIALERDGEPSRSPSPRRGHPTDDEGRLRGGLPAETTRAHARLPGGARRASAEDARLCSASYAASWQPATPTCSACARSRSGSPLHQLAPHRRRPALREHARPAGVALGARRPRLVRRVPDRSRSTTARTPLLRASESRSEFGDRLSLEVFRDVGDSRAPVPDRRRRGEDLPARARTPPSRRPTLQPSSTTLTWSCGWFRAYVLYLDGEPIAFWQGRVPGVFVHTGCRASTRLRGPPRRQLRALQADRRPLRRHEITRSTTASATPSTSAASETELGRAGRARLRAAAEGHPGERRPHGGDGRRRAGATSLAEQDDRRPCEAALARPPALDEALPVLVGVERRRDVGDARADPLDLGGLEPPPPRRRCSRALSSRTSCFSRSSVGFPSPLCAAIAPPDAVVDLDAERREQRLEARARARGRGPRGGRTSTPGGDPGRSPTVW